MNSCAKRAAKLWNISAPSWVFRQRSRMHARTQVDILCMLVDDCSDASPKHVALYMHVYACTCLCILCYTCLCVVCMCTSAYDVTCGRLFRHQLVERCSPPLCPLRLSDNSAHQALPHHQATNGVSCLASFSRGPFATRTQSIPLTAHTLHPIRSLRLEQPPTILEGAQGTV